MNVLVVDDDSVCRLILSATVASLGHTCLVAVDGEQAWALFQQTPVELVVSDWQMPGLSGLALCQQVRAFPDRPYTYFILITAHSGLESVTEGLAAGADDYVVKPLNPVDLKARLLVAQRFIHLHHQLAEKETRCKQAETTLRRQQELFERLREVAQDMAREPALAKTLQNALKRLLEEMERQGP